MLLQCTCFYGHHIQASVVPRKTLCGASLVALSLLDSQHEMLPLVLWIPAESVSSSSHSYQDSWIVSLQILIKKKKSSSSSSCPFCKINQLRFWWKWTHEPLKWVVINTWRSWISTGSIDWTVSKSWWSRFMNCEFADLDRAEQKLIHHHLLRFAKTYVHRRKKN
jgi:hypothetical protein